MCEPVSIGLAAVALIGGLSGAHDQAKAEGAAEDAKRKSQIQMIKQMNYANADLKMDLQDKSEQARQKLTDINLKSLRNQGMLNAAIGESGLSGNSLNRIKRVTAADSARESDSVIENYQRDYQSIFANEVGNVENTKSAIEGAAPTLRTSGLSKALGVIGSTAGAAAQGYGVDQANAAAAAK
ncbi:hypothetical protein [Pseudomonas sp. B14(2017)]|uniref:virion core protein, T7 gp14 family n=1 Tax=Pseudomonas sp. B14(2017) TaxID=1981745 RepID=UPI000A1E5A87|nr:hypothetical protein [Pseudomonas sp. B14(2017)]